MSAIFTDRDGNCVQCGRFMGAEPTPCGADCAAYPDIGDTAQAVVDNPPAFAAIAVSAAGDISGNDGMSLRDWFAGQALAQATREIWESHKYEDVAKRAYGIADAMLAERSKASGDMS